jgi:hypothetical protein
MSIAKTFSSSIEKAITFGEEYAHAAPTGHERTKFQNQGDEIDSCKAQALSSSASKPSPVNGSRTIVPSSPPVPSNSIFAAACLLVTMTTSLTLNSFNVFTLGRVVVAESSRLI